MSTVKLKVRSAEAFYVVEGNIVRTKSNVRTNGRRGLRGVGELRHVRTSRTGTWEVCVPPRRVAAGAAAGMTGVRSR